MGGSEAWKAIAYKPAHEAATGMDYKNVQKKLTEEPVVCFELFLSHLIVNHVQIHVYMWIQGLGDMNKND